MLITVQTVKGEKGEFEIDKSVATVAGLLEQVQGRWGAFDDPNCGRDDERNGRIVFAGKPWPLTASFEDMGVEAGATVYWVNVPTPHS